LSLPVKTSESGEIILDKTILNKELSGNISTKEKILKK